MCAVYRKHRHTVAMTQREPLHATVTHLCIAWFISVIYKHAVARYEEMEMAAENSTGPDRQTDLICTQASTITALQPIELGSNTSRSVDEIKQYTYLY